MGNLNQTVIPQSKTQMVAFLRARMATWKAQAENLGMTEAQTQLLEDHLSDTEALLENVVNARLASKSATGSFDVGAATLRALAQQAVERIRVQAQSTNNPDLYNLAMIPAPQPPTPAGPPEVPTDVFADPNADASVTVRWKGSASHGQFFTIWRRVGENGNWSQIATIAGRTRVFNDFTVPSPVTTNGASLFYMVRGQRGTQVSGPSNFGVIQYGAGPGFAVTTVKMAA